MRSIGSRLRVRLARELSGRILDCGSGDDIFGSFLRREGNKVISLDVDEKTLEQTQGTCVVSSCAEMPFTDDYFDAIWACAIIEHVRQETLPEMIRVTRPGGRLIAVTPNRHSPFDCVKRLVGMATWDENEGHVRLYGFEELSFYGPVHGETFFVPFMGRFFWNFPHLAHVWIMDLKITRELKQKVKKRFPKVFDPEPKDYARIVP